MPAYNFCPFPVLVTERLLLQQLTAANVDFIKNLRNNDTVNQYLNRPQTVTRDEALLFIEKINLNIENATSVYWIIVLKETNEPIGTACLWNFDTEKNMAETGYELYPSFHGKGFMREALKAVLDYGFNQLRLTAITAFTDPNNAASIKLLEHHHFKITSTPEAVTEEIVFLLIHPAAI